MFTGLIENVGRLTARERRGAAGKLVVQTALPLSEFNIGDSVAVNGACLTVERILADRRALQFHTLAETLDRTNLGRRPLGSLVNLERSMRPGDRLGGHFVLGHVDACAPVLEIGRAGDDIRLRVALPPDLAPLVIPKGSIAVDGISLTIAALADDWFECRIIPHTWEATNLHGLSAGDVVNLEADVLGKYVQRFLALREAGAQSETADNEQKSGLTLEDLREAGFTT